MTEPVKIVEDLWTHQAIRQQIKSEPGREMLVQHPAPGMYQDLLERLLLEGKDLEENY